MGRSFARTLWESFKSAINAVIAGLALVLSLALWLLVPDAQVSLRWLVPIGTLAMVLLLTLVFTLIEAALRSYDQAKEAVEDRSRVQAEYEDYKARTGLPRVVAGREPFAGTNAELVCFLEPSNLFFTDIMVSFFSVNEQNLEEPIGVGVIGNIQENGIIQASMTHALLGHEDFVDRLKRNEKEAVGTTRVKPYVSQGHTNL